MKRVLLSVGIGLALAFIFLLLLSLVLLKRPDLDPPRYIPLQTAPSLLSHQRISYDFLNPRPFESGQMWIHSSIGNTNPFRTFLYDLDERKIVGQITNGWPIMRIDRSTLLCSQPLFGARSLKEHLLEMVGRIVGNRLTLARVSGSEPQRYWLLDLEKNEATEMGEISQHPSSHFQASPDLHYGYFALSGRGLEAEVHCFDFKTGTITKRGVHGWPSGWWDQTNILVLTTNNDFVLYDVITEKAAPLIGAQRIPAFLKEHSIAANPATARTFFTWNGRENEFYLTDGHQKWQAAESFLIKVHKPDARLTLVAPQFKFEWSDNFDQTGRYYAYSGRVQGQASDGVFLRDTETGTNRILVTPTTDRYFSIPRFYENSIIYIRSNSLWRINLEGTENQQLFPPPESNVTP